MGKIKFGTDGWRAVISEDFTFENVKIVAQAIADYAKSRKAELGRKKSELYKRKYALLVGYDTRFLSETYASLIASVLAANGIEVVLADRPTPTPSVSYYIRYKNYMGGIMITASHNPGRYNGIKYKGHFGGSVTGDVTDVIEGRLYKTKVKFIDLDAAKNKKLVRTENIIPFHIAQAREFVDMDLLKQADLRILVDSMNGAGGLTVQESLKGTDIKVFTMNSARDAYFGGRSPEPNEKVLKDTAVLVKEGSYDLGFASDGDADRLGVILPNGEVLSGHKVMTLLLLHLLEDRKMTGGVVQTICGTGLIDKICAEYGLKRHETSVGFKYISEIMEREDILIGGEETGGVAIKGWLPERDSLMSAMLILEMIAYRKKTLKEIVDDVNNKYGTFVYKRFDTHYPPDKKKILVSTLKTKPFKKVLDKTVVEVKSFDGFKFSCPDGTWLMLRLSGTEPKLRVYSEGRSEKEAEELLDFGKKFALNIK